MSASHNPGGPEYDWGIKVTLSFSSYSHPLNSHWSIEQWPMLIVGAPEVTVF